MVGSNWKITRFIQDRFRRVARWVGKHPKVARFFSVTRKAVVRWMMHGGARMAAALAFYTAISLAPLLTMVISIIGFIYGEEAARGALVEEIEQLTDQRAAAFIQTMIADAGNVKRGVVSSLISLAILLWGSTRLFYQMQETLNIIWDASDAKGMAIVKAARQRLIAFGMTLVAAFLLLVSLVLNAALSYITESARVNLPGSDLLWALGNQAISLLMIWGLFASIYKFLPERSVPWSTAMIGALVAAVLFSIGKQFMGVYLATQDSVQQASGALMAVLIWVYFSAQIFYFGAEVTKATSEGSDEPIDCVRPSPQS